MCLLGSQGCDSLYTSITSFVAAAADSAAFEENLASERRSELMHYYSVIITTAFHFKSFLIFIILAVLSLLPSGRINVFINVQMPPLPGHIFY